MLERGQKTGMAQNKGKRIGEERGRKKKKSSRKEEKPSKIELKVRREK